MPESVESTHNLKWLIRDSWNEAVRHLRVMPRQIDFLIFATLQPVMFVLLFVYVFGGSISAPGFDNYKQYLLPGIFAQTVVFGTTATSVGLAEDMTKGFVDRLRSLPIVQSSVLVGRTMSDLARNVMTFVIMLAVAFAVGFRFKGSLFGATEATALLLLFSYAFSWIQAFLGIKVKSVEAANSAGFIWMFPLTFISSAFVPTQNMTPWLRRIAENNPFTVATNAGRALYNGNPAGDNVWKALLWAIGIIVVFATLSIRTFARSTNR
jgi:ABC-2 type transport system permease protein